jgi:glycosyltransferase involved in cell wall biosynthesis
MIPCYEHGEPVRGVVESLARYGLPIRIIDDGSGPATQEALGKLALDFPLVRVHRRDANGGKGAALKLGFALAAAEGFTHVLHLDADGQHDASAVPEFLEVMRQHPDAVVLGQPIFDATAPRSRLWARQLSRFAVWVATLSLRVRDPLCGMRGVPLEPTLAMLATSHVGNRMEFDPEFAVRAIFAGMPVRNVPVRVIYVPGGISHFDVGRDFPVMGATYLRLWGDMLTRIPQLLAAARSDS